MMQLNEKNVCIERGEQGSRSAKAHGEGTTPDEKHTVGGVEWDWCGGGGIGLGLSIE